MVTQNIPSTRAFLQYDATDPELLRRAVPESLQPALRNAKFLDMGKKEFNGVPYNAGFVVFENAEDAARFAAYFSDEEPRIMRAGEEGSSKLYTPVRRDVTINHLTKIGPTESVTHDTVTGETTHQITGGERVVQTQTNAQFYSVGIKGRHFTPEMIGEAFGCQVHSDPASLGNQLVKQTLQQQQGGPNFN